MRLMQYEVIPEEVIRAKTQRLFAPSLSCLDDLDFTERGWLRQSMFPLSGVLFLLTFQRYDRIGGFLQVISDLPVRLHAKRYAYVLLNEYGAVFTTLFDDGLRLQTFSYADYGIRSISRAGYERQVCAVGDLRETWRQHQEGMVRLRQDRLPVEIRSLSDVISLEETFATLALREDTGYAPHRKEKW